MTVNIQDLGFFGCKLRLVTPMPRRLQNSPAAANGQQLAENLRGKNESKVVKASVPKGFSYTRGIAVLEQLARALTPNKTALLANYPNPFNPETWIPYQLSKAADVTVTIYASDGSVIRTLAFRGNRDVGMYKNRSRAAYWDGKNELGESVARWRVFLYPSLQGISLRREKLLILK